MEIHVLYVRMYVYSSILKRDRNYLNCRNCLSILFIDIDRFDTLTFDKMSYFCRFRHRRSHLRHRMQNMWRIWSRSVTTKGIAMARRGQGKIRRRHRRFGPFYIVWTLFTSSVLWETGLHMKICQMIMGRDASKNFPWLAARPIMTPLK